MDDRKWRNAYSESDDDDEDKCWKRVRQEEDQRKVEMKEPDGTAKKDTNQNVVAVRDMFEMSSGDDEVETTPKDKKSPCPIIGCDIRTQKVRNHVNRMHLPKIMWDNNSPPVRRDRYWELHKIRVQVLVFLSQKITGYKSIMDLLRWCQEPYSCKI